MTFDPILGSIPASVPLRILLVEDHDDTRRSIEWYLKAHGHSVESARTVGEAMALINRASYDVLISDLGLPDGTGWEVARRTTELAPHTYAVAISGYGMVQDRARSKAVGFRSHLLKPFTPDELDTILSHATEAVLSHRSS